MLWNLLVMLAVLGIGPRDRAMDWDLNGWEYREQ